MTQPIKHAFLSYVHEDEAAVDRLQEALEEAGIAVWRDVEDLWPGDDWQQKIREAIQDGSLAFIICMSSTSVEKLGYQNVEILLAVAEYQLRPPGTSWLIPVRLDDCQVPAFDLAPGKTLRSLQYVDFFGARESAAAVRIVTTVNRILHPAAGGNSTIRTGTTQERHGAAPLVESVKILLRDPNGDIQLEELVEEATDEAIARFHHEETFPPLLPSPAAGAELTIKVRDQMEAYEEALTPLTEALILGGTFGKPEHDRIWTRTVEMVSSAPTTDTAQLRKFPTLWLMYATAIASVARNNFTPLLSVTEKPEMREPPASKGPAIAFVNGRILFGDQDWLPSAIIIAEDENISLDDNLVRALQTKQRGRRHTPVSEILYKRLRPFFTRLIRDNDTYTVVFDKAEIILDLITTDLRLHRDVNHWLPAHPNFGCYTWRYEYAADPFGGLVTDDDHLLKELTLAGAFHSSPERAHEAFVNLSAEAKALAEVRW